MTTNETSFEEILISLVFLRPAIYDKMNPSHAKKLEVAEAWKDVGKEAGRTVEVCMKRWKDLRDTFYRKYRGMGGKSGDGLDDIVVDNWKWYGQLMFLSEYNMPTRTTDNFPSTSNVDLEQLMQYSTSESSQEEGFVLEYLAVNSVSSDVASPTIAPPLPSPPVSTKSTLCKVATHPIKRPHVWYKEHCQSNPPKRDSAVQWGGIIDKCQKVLENTSAAGSAVDIDPFASYPSRELKRLSEEEQDNLKLGIVDMIRSIKQKRTA